MVFKRRVRPSLLSRLREAVLPKRGYRRGVEYLGHRVRRLPDTPHRIALGFACGVFSSFTPFFGFHIIFAAVIARLVRSNIVAALIGTAVGNPLTFPLIAPVALGIGRSILGHGASGEDYHRVSDAVVEGFMAVRDGLLSLVGLGHSDWGKLVPFFHDILWPYLVGGMVPGVIAGVASYYLVRALVTAYQARRRARMLARAHQRLAERQVAPEAARLRAYTGRAGAAAGREAET